AVELETFNALRLNLIFDLESVGRCGPGIANEGLIGNEQRELDIRVVVVIGGEVREQLPVEEDRFHTRLIRRQMLRIERLSAFSWVESAGFVAAGVFGVEQGILRGIVIYACGSGDRAPAFAELLLIAKMRCPVRCDRRQRAEIDERRDQI